MEVVILQYARVVAIVLVIVLDDDAGRLEDVPRVVDPPPQVGFLPAAALRGCLILDAASGVIARRRTLLPFLGAGGQIALLAPAPRVLVLQQVALAADPVAELGRAGRVVIG